VLRSAWSGLLRGVRRRDLNGRGPRGDRRSRRQKPTSPTANASHGTTTNHIFTDNSITSFQASEHHSSPAGDALRVL
jgi:hypothetical protein